VGKRHYRSRRTPKPRATARADSKGSDSTHSQNPPSCLWRELWLYDVGEDRLSMNAHLWRDRKHLSIEFYVFWNSTRLPQFDFRTDQPQNKQGLIDLVTAKANVILRRCGIEIKP